MTKRHTRLFFVGGTLLFAAIFVGMTIDSHRQFDRLTNASQITPDVSAGKDVWHEKNCINCHTLLGEGAYYAPDLTKITQQRGATYLRAFLKDPSQFYSERVHRRLMPNPELNEQQITQVIAFLDWVSKIDNQGWPPRPILVSGGQMAGAAAVSEPSAAASSDPVALGEVLFRSTPPGCFACHSISAGVNLAGPSLAGIGTRAATRVDSAGYGGQARDAAGYIRESIVAPHAHLVPGQIYSAGGRSFMPDNYETMLTPEQIDQIVAYLVTLR
jgi:nitric oxide reductase subunit C